MIGKTAKYVKAENAAEYIFGYTLDNDVSDRGGRADGRHGSDWVLGKSHDTFFPMGPYVVPRQFVPNPQKLPIKFSLSGKVMQDSNTDRMTHTVFELVEYASHLMTLRPGDLISSGSPAGVGTARGTPIYFKDGDTRRARSKASARSRTRCARRSSRRRHEAQVESDHAWYNATLRIDPDRARRRQLHADRPHQHHRDDSRVLRRGAGGLRAGRAQRSGAQARDACGGGGRPDRRARRRWPAACRRRSPAMPRGRR